jgi:hypothetical protein
MRTPAILVILGAAPLLCAQDGQRPSRPGWPCVAGRPVDPAYLDVSESTGGELFMFQRSETGQSLSVMTASRGYKAAILRAVGNLGGTRDFEFPVDSTVSSLLIMGSIQCRKDVLLLRPNGSEITAVNAAQNIDLQAGRVIRVDQPEPGPWRVRLSGTGLFLLSVAAKSSIALSTVAFAEGTADARLSGEASGLKLQLVDASGAPLSAAQPLEAAEGGIYRAPIARPATRFRVLVTGSDASAWPFQRIYPLLFRELTK